MIRHSPIAIGEHVGDRNRRRFARRHRRVFAAMDERIDENGVARTRPVAGDLEFFAGVAAAEAIGINHRAQPGERGGQPVALGLVGARPG